MRWLLIAPLVLLAVGVIMYLIGLLRPRTHTARTRLHLTSSPEPVWGVITDHEHWAEWQPGLKRVELLPETEGMTALVAEGSWGEMPMRIEVSDPPRRFVTFLDGGTFSGRWTWELEAAPEGGTVVSLREDGEVGNPLFRTTTIFHDNHKSMLGALRGLAARLGETAEPAKVD